MMANIIETLEKEEIARLGKKIPKFAPGDTVAVGVNVIEGTRFTIIKRNKNDGKYY
jgi:large subunit ribosomal protein L19